VDGPGVNEPGRVYLYIAKYSGGRPESWINPTESNEQSVSR